MLLLFLAFFCSCFCSSVRQKRRWKMRLRVPRGRTRGLRRLQRHDRVCHGQIKPRLGPRLEVILRDNTRTEWASGADDGVCAPWQTNTESQWAEKGLAWTRLLPTRFRAIVLPLAWRFCVVSCVLLRPLSTRSVFLFCFAILCHSRPWVWAILSDYAPFV